MSRFRIAFIGVDHPHGAGWRQALGNLPEEIEITTVATDFPGSLGSLEESLARVPRFDSWQQLLAQGLHLFDGAILCLPNDRTPAAITALADSGKHVLLEKPGAASAAELCPALDAVRRAGVAYQNGYLWRYDEGAERLQAMIHDGRLGKLISLEMTCVTSDALRRGPAHYLFDPGISGGGFFNWLGCHWLDLMHFVSGDRVASVTARTGVFGATTLQVEDGGAAILELGRGGLVVMVGGYWLPRWAGDWHWTLRGSERWVHWNPNRAGTGGVIEIHGPQPQFQAMDETFSLPADSTPGYGGYRAVALLRDWIQSARQPGRSCRNTPESTLATLELIDEIYAASKEGKSRRSPPSRPVGGRDHKESGKSFS